MGFSSVILRSTALPLLLRRDKRPTALRHWRELERSQYRPLQDLLDEQWLKLTALLQHAYESVPYYRRIFDERKLTPASFRSFEDLTQLPPLGRETIRSNESDLISSRYPTDNLHRFGTGGTTRRRMFLYRDWESTAIKMGAAWRFEGYMGRRPGDKIALIWPTHIDLDPRESWRARLRNRYLTREQMYSVGAATENELEVFYRRLVAFRPRFLKGFPNALYRFTEYIDSRGYHLPPIDGIMVTGEALQGYQRRRFVDVFGAPVFNMYGSREVGNTASECEYHDGLHVAMETSLVEVVEDGKLAGADEEGEIYITDLTNFGFPMIRYAIEDFGTWMDGSCPCGRSLRTMSPGVGRVMDQYIAPDGSRHSALALSASIADGGPPLGQVQYQQKTLTHYHLLVTNDPPFSPEIERHIRSTMHRLLSPDIEITIEVINALPREKSGKIRYFVCEVEQDTGKS